MLDAVSLLDQQRLRRPPEDDGEWRTVAGVLLVVWLGRDQLHFNGGRVIDVNPKRLADQRLESLNREGSQIAHDSMLTMPVL
jgi:hypothetical protein